MIFLVFVVHFRAQKYQKLSFDGAKKSIFRMSACYLYALDMKKKKSNNWQKLNRN